MTGKMSRNKGARNERLLVEHLKSLGYNALRVPLSGAMKGYKYDVIATKDNVDYSFELKVRANEYATIYHYFNENKIDGVARASTSEGHIFAMSDDFEKIKIISSNHYPLMTDRTTKKIFNMEKLTQGADYLVLRGDRMGFLFINYSMSVA